VDILAVGSAEGNQSCECNVGMRVRDQLPQEEVSCNITVVQEEW